MTYFGFDLRDNLGEHKFTLIHNLDASKQQD
nr:MAG TPA: hypothetical protein [Caudoviricetes sp.]